MSGGGNPSISTLESLCILTVAIDFFFEFFFGVGTQQLTLKYYETKLSTNAGTLLYLV